MHMIAVMTTLALTAGAPQQMDTTFQVEAGTRLELNNRSGMMRLTGWGQDRIRILATTKGGERVQLSRRGKVVSVTSVPGMDESGDDGSVDYRISLPAGMDVSVQGVDSGIQVDGLSGSVRLQTVDGDVHVKGPARSLSAQSVDGVVRVEGVRGDVSLFAVDGDVELRDAEGDVSAQSVDGDIRLLRVRASKVKASTTDGDVVFVGPLRDGGHYELHTHDGDIQIGVPTDASATFRGSTFDGSVDTAIPLTLQRTGDHGAFQAVLGSGAAEVELRSFSGDIQIRRPADVDSGDHD